MTTIARLRAINFKRLVDVDLTLDQFTKITGANGNGKSSVLDAVRWALQGGRALPDTPIRVGTDQAEVIATFSDGRVVTRRVTAKGATVELRSAEGAKYDKPQSLLDGETGVLSFDPLQFVGKSERDQVRELLAIAAPDFDLEAVESRRARTFESRTATGRELKRAEGHVEALGQPVDAPAQEVSASAIHAEIRQAQQAEAENRTLRANRHRAIATLAEAKAAAAAAQERLRIAAEAEIAASRALDAGLQAVPDVDALMDKLAEVDSVNSAVRHNAEIAKAIAARDTERAAYTARSQEIVDLDKAKSDALAGAKLPVDGLGFSGDKVTFNGVPLSQASSAEQLRVSMAIAAAANPDMRVVLIQNGSLLDSLSLADVERIARETDTQVLIEIVDESGDVGIVIENGEVAA